MALSRVPQRPHGLNLSRHLDKQEAPSSNHMASALPREVKSKVASMGLRRVAGNVYESPSTRDFWEVKGNKIKRLTKGSTVDNGEKILGADAGAPQSFLDEILGDLTF